MSLRAMLLSNSTQHGRGYLDHAIEELRDHLSGVRRLAFVPFALNDHAAYGAKVRDRLAPLGIEVAVVPADGRALRALEEAEAIFVGGGNTFRLLHRMIATGLVAAIRREVFAGKPYVGASAGTVVGGPTIRTTNDMPIVHPETLDALALVPFQINCHYLDADPASTHMGETRETRLREFHEENETPVVGLREGAWIRVAGDRATLRGTTGARLFVRGDAPRELAAGADLGGLCPRR
ncbi:MAG TPA: dipeptidase PepE [Verrucomicrobiae bacterium]|nr:dipeptidase PepE [Verrucomicrobiae bacterium]